MSERKEKEKDKERRNLRDKIVSESGDRPTRME